MTRTRILWGLVLILVFCVGFFAGRVSVFLSAVSTDTGVSAPSAPVNHVVTPTSSAQKQAPATSAGTKVDPARLSDGQRAMLRALGVNVDTLVVTPGMVACAEASLGTARALEIKNGATPSFIEGAKLVACYK